MNALDSLKPTLDAIPTQGVRAPHLPIATALQEATDLLHLCRTDGVRSAISAAGLAAGFTDEVDQRIEAARLAQSLWVDARDVTKSSALVEQKQRATDMRSDMIAAARWNLPDDREAHATLSSIRGSDVEVRKRPVAQIARAERLRVQAIVAQTWCRICSTSPRSTRSTPRPSRAISTSTPRPAPPRRARSRPPCPRGQRDPRSRPLRVSS